MIVDHHMHVRDPEERVGYIAYAPQNAGRDLGRALEHAHAAGYETVTMFEGRRRRQEPLG